MNRQHADAPAFAEAVGNRFGKLAPVAKKRAPRVLSGRAVGILASEA